MKAKKPVYLRWWYFALAALFAVSGMSLFGQDNGAAALGLVFCAAMVGWSIYKKKVGPKAVPVGAPGQPFSFQAAGVYHHQGALISVASPGRGFDLPDDQFAERFSDGRSVYQYYFNNCVGALVPEPENPHDPNAIKVTLDGACVGYVPADLTGTVAALMAHNPAIKISARGGPRRYTKDGAVYKLPGDFTVYVDITP